MADGGRRISTIELAIPPNTGVDALHGMARRCLVAYFEDDEGDFPIAPTDMEGLPDTVIIRNRADDLPICRWTYVDEIIARFQNRFRKDQEERGRAS
jgi:hypothetical protein